MTPANLAALLLEALSSAPPSPTERALCGVIESHLRGFGLVYAREVVVKGGRLDFTVGLPPALAIEVKVGGSLAALTRQLYRYAVTPDLAGFVVVTTRSEHQRLPAVLDGRPVAVCYLGGLYL